MAPSEVAVCYYQPIPKLIENVNGHSYYFSCEWSVSLYWVLPEDVNALLALRGGCCGQHRPICHVATENEIKVFQTGHY
jgi:hypothetical protein